MFEKEPMDAWNQDLAELMAEYQMIGNSTISKKSSEECDVDLAILQYAESRADSISDPKYAGNWYREVIYIWRLRRRELDSLISACAEQARFWDGDFDVTNLDKVDKLCRDVSQQYIKNGFSKSSRRPN